MPAAVDYRFIGYKRVRNDLRKLASEYRREIDETIKDWTKSKRARLKSYGYPPQTNKPQPFKTEKQRRFFFWALREGIIVVPYPRTGRLANSWSANKEGWANWVLKNSAIYAKFVIAKDTQSNYHKGNWWVAEDVIDEDVSELTKALTERLEGFIS